MSPTVSGPVDLSVCLDNNRRYALISTEAPI